MVLKREPVNLEDLIEQAWRSHQASAGRRKFVRRYASVPQASADRHRVTQVLEHLLSNAIQFTPEDGTITVSINAQDGAIAVSVTDNGVGIAREELSRLFGKFVQPGRAEEERSGGTGLGLAFCKQIVELHGGRLLVTSELGQGASFTFLLPVSGPT